MKQSRIHVFLTLFLVVQIVFLKWLATQPNLVEKYYSNGIFPAISRSMRTFFGWIPFSIGDLLYLFIVFILLRFVFKLFQKKTHRKPITLLKITGFLSIIYFLFHLLWGLNYYRIPLSKKMFHSTQNGVDSIALITFTKRVIKQINSLQLSIENDSTQMVIQPYSFKKQQLIAIHSFDNISKELSFLKYKKPSIKHSLFSLPLTYMGFSGYINPFTLETQVNNLHTKVNKPTTILHEMSHQIGYAAENEANFIACITALKSKDVYFKYAGLFMALRHCMYDVYRLDKQTYLQLNKTLNKGIIANLQVLRNFNNRYKNPLEPIFKISYNLFLKANNQHHGIQSYSYMVALLMAYDAQQNNLLLVPSLNN